ncbi:MAG: universal stress protein [Slackia sp.]|nr:universal stress protein [Slackia sp.]
MALSKILVAYDGSKESASALDLAADLARADAAVKIDIVNVVAIPMLTDEQLVSFESVLDLMERDSEELLGNAIDRIDEAGIENDIETFMLNGTDAATEIAKLAEQEDYDIVVIGSRGIGGIKGYLGSVGHKLLSICNKPVLVAK